MQDRMGRGEGKVTGRQETLTPEEFEKRFGEKNDPEKVRLTGK